ncbi:hypothetical protein [Streptomyces sp. NPDC046821]
MRDQDAWLCFEDEAGQSLRKGSGGVSLAGLVWSVPGPATAPA